MTEEQIQTLTNLEFMRRKGMTATKTVDLPSNARKRNLQLEAIHRIEYPFHIEPMSGPDPINIGTLVSGCSSWKLCELDGLVEHWWRKELYEPEKHWLRPTMRSAALLREYRPAALYRVTRPNAKNPPAPKSGGHG